KVEVGVSFSYESYFGDTVRQGWFDGFPPSRERQRGVNFTLTTFASVKYRKWLYDCGQRSGRNDMKIKGRVYSPPFTVIRIIFAGEINRR
ncbi:MAG: hypothetical protein ACLPVI_02985, partial [Dehalococcoidales bacterium]